MLMLGLAHPGLSRLVGAVTVYLAQPIKQRSLAGNGDLHVIVNVVVPGKLGKRERELLRELDEVSQPAVVPRGGASVFDRLRDLFD